MPRTASGSSRSAFDVKPTRSAKKIVMTLRSSPRGAAEASAVPQEWQKRACSGFVWPHAVQVFTGLSLEAVTNATSQYADQASGRLRSVGDKSAMFRAVFRERSNLRHPVTH